jgi:hypothetical protein
MELNPYEAPQLPGDCSRANPPAGPTVSVAGCAAGCASVLVVLASGVLAQMLMVSELPEWQGYIVLLGMISVGWIIVWSAYGQRLCGDQISRLPKSHKKVRKMRFCAKMNLIETFDHIRGLL